ncbi:nuclear transport factor 2 family protein [Croceiramulus getboli]|nr:nuclear transport factor 2 family protein [Flavobacteriaceae bacterium YJPT1-3]
MLNSQAQNSKAERIVQSNLDAYNAHDIDAFMSFFSEDVHLVNFDDQQVTAEGIEAVRAIYEPYFEASPELHSKILTRIVFDNKVIDHEYITGRYGNNDALELVLIYEVMHNKISQITVLREEE